jgi:hypothetical protein
MNNTETNQPTVLNKKKLRGTLPDSVYVGRPSIWGNPFVIGRDGTRDEVIMKYETWLVQQPTLLAKLDRLTGKHLICWCGPARCHADVLLRLANGARLRCD